LHEILYKKILRKSVQKIKVSLKSYKHKGYLSEELRIFILQLYGALLIFRAQDYVTGKGKVKTWSLTLWEERRLRVFENKVLRRIFGPRRDEVTGEWRRLHNEELNDLYSSPNIIRVIKSRRMRWAGNVARMGEKRGVYRVLVEKPEGTRPLGRPRRRWVDNIRMDLQEVGCGYMDWIGLA